MSPIRCTHCGLNDAPGNWHELRPTENTPFYCWGCARTQWYSVRNRSQNDMDLRWQLIKASVRYHYQYDQGPSSGITEDMEVEDWILRTWWTAVSCDACHDGRTHLSKVLKFYILRKQPLDKFPVWRMGGYLKWQYDDDGMQLLPPDVRDKWREGIRIRENR
jgi:hypothetical protein